MRILLTKPDSLGDQFIAAGPVQALLRRRPDIRITWHVRPGMEVIAPLLGAAVFRPQEAAAPADEAARLAAETGRLILVPYPLVAYEPWTGDLRRRVAWWAAFLHAGSWDTTIIGVVNRNWVADLTATLAPAPACIGFEPNATRQPLVNEAHALAGDGPRLTTRLTSSFTRREADQLRDLFAVIEPALGGSDTAWRAAETWQRPGGTAAPRVLIAPGVGGDPRRAWGAANFLTVATALRDRGAESAWIEGPGDAPYLEGVPATETRRRFAEDALPELCAELRAADLLLCHDTAYAHLAAGVGIPTVALYGAGQDGRFHPMGGRVKVVQSDIACAGCQWHCLWDRMVCVSDIPVASVIDACSTMLAGDSGNQRVALTTPVANAPEGELAAVKRRLQGEVLALNADRFARLQIIQSLLAPPAPPEPGPPPPSPPTGPAALSSAAPDVEPAAPTVPAEPRFSVIIPMGRPERARGTLDSLARQARRPAQWEILAVGVGLTGIREGHPDLPITIVELPASPGPAHKRAEGVLRATGEWYVFIDDDVRLAPDFFAQAISILDRAAAANDHRVGAIGAKLPGGRGTYFEGLTDISNFWSQQSPRPATPHAAWFLYSATMLVRAEAYRRSGGFNPELLNGEDVDLTQRIQAAGYILGYEPTLVAYHFHGQDTLFRMWRYFWRNGNAAPYFFAQFGGVCCYSVRTVLTRAWGDLQMNRRHQRSQGVRLGLRVPWILINYFIVEMSLERHYQAHLWANQRFRALPARTRSDNLAARAFAARAEGRKLRAALVYGAAMLLNLADPVRR